MQLNFFVDWKYNPWLFAVVLLGCFLLSTVVRYQQFETWGKNPSAYFVGERPLMTTLDAPFWLRMSREYNEGSFGQKRRLRMYPDNTKTFQQNYTKALSILEDTLRVNEIYKSSLPWLKIILVGDNIILIYILVTDSKMFILYRVSLVYRPPPHAASQTTTLI